MALFGIHGEKSYASAILGITILATAYLGVFLHRKSVEYGTLNEIEGYVEEYLDPQAVRKDKIPIGIKRKSIYIDSDQDGDLDSYIKWYNRLGRDRLIKMVDSGNGIDFPELAPKAVRPDEPIPGFYLDYHSIDGSEFLESFDRIMDFYLYKDLWDAEETLVRIEKVDGLYYWSELEKPSDGSRNKASDGAGSKERSRWRAEDLN